MKPRLLIFLVLILFSACASVEKKYAKASSTELKLRHHQLSESLGSDTGPDIEWIKPIFFRGPSRAQRTEEKQEIEFELLRRYKAGDQEAQLPFFD